MEKLNSTVSDEEREIELLIQKNTLLEQLVSTLRENNELKGEKLVECRNNHIGNIINRKTYAEVTNELKPKPKRIPKITIKINNPTQKNTLDLIKNFIASDKSTTKFLRSK